MCKIHVHSLASNKQLNSYTSIQFSPSHTPTPSSRQDSVLHGASFLEQLVTEIRGEVMHTKESAGQALSSDDSAGNILGKVPTHVGTFC